MVLSTDLSFFREIQARLARSRIFFLIMLFKNSHPMLHFHKTIEFICVVCGGGVSTYNFLNVRRLNISVLTYFMRNMLLSFLSPMPSYFPVFFVVTGRCGEVTGRINPRMDYAFCLLHIEEFWKGVIPIIWCYRQLQSHKNGLMYVMSYIF
jgi:hypothetical protein